MPTINNQKPAGVHVKNVLTLSCKDRTVVPWNLTVRTTAIEGNTTDSADIVVRDVPFPYCDGVDSFDFDFHGQPVALDFDGHGRLSRFEVSRWCRPWGVDSQVLMSSV